MLFRPSGGLIYHLRASRSRELWRPFNQAVAAWLRGWQPSSDELILLGPSGGYTLPPEFLQRFKKIHAFDTDWLAPLFFRRRHPGAVFSREDLFWQSEGIGIEGLQLLLNRTPHAAILFSNILGQLPLEANVDEAKWNVFLARLAGALRDRSYASYHDLYSITPLDQALHAAVFQEINLGVPLDQLKSLNAAPTAQITDHLLAAMTWPQARAKTLMPWSLRRDSLHVVQGVLGPA